MSLGGRQITEDDIRQYLAMQGNAQQRLLP